MEPIRRGRITIEVRINAPDVELGSSRESYKRLDSQLYIDKKNKIKRSVVEVRVAAHQFHSGSQPLQNPMSLFCLFLMRKDKPK